MPSKDDDSKKAAERERLTQQVAVMQKAARAQTAARNLREKARKVADPKERSRMIEEAYAKEVEAHGQSKLAQRMQSGAWQGAGFGGGIGGGVGLGLGAVVGTLVGGLVSIPTTGIGALVGTGVGLVHGPWIKLGGGDRKKWEDAKPEEVVDAIEHGRVEDLPDDGNAAPSPQAKRKPRKIEVRSHAATSADRAAEDHTSTSKSDTVDPENVENRPPVTAAEVDEPSSAPVKKPRKIEIRSSPKTQEA